MKKTAKKSAKPELLKKPKAKRSNQSAYDYGEVTEYIEKKYGVDLNDYSGHLSGYEPEYKRLCKERGLNFKKMWSANPKDLKGQEKKDYIALREEADKFYERVPFQCFWHYILDICEIHNGCYFGLYFGELDDEPTEYQPAWVKEILKMIKDEFKPKNDEMEFWVSW